MTAGGSSTFAHIWWIEALEPRRMLSSPTYNVVDIGTLGSTQFMGATNPTAINNSGVVVGLSPTAAEVGHAFIYQGGVMTDLGQQMGPQVSSIANAVNDQGHVAGVLTQMGTGGGLSYTGFFYNGSTVTKYAPTNADYVNFNGINNTDQIVGVYAFNGGGGRAFISAAGATPNELVNIAPQLKESSNALAINNLGQIVGEYTPPNSGGGASYLLDGTNFTGLEPGLANAISQNGNVAGWHYVTSPTTGQPIISAYIYTGGKVQDIGTLDGVRGIAWGVNNMGQVVGESGGHAFLYSNGVLSDLNTLIPANSGWVLTRANAINNKGEIVGEGTYKGQVNHGFLLTGGLMLHIADTEPVLGVVRPSDVIHYTITATASPDNVQSIVIKDPIPVGTTIVPRSITNGGVLQRGMIVWTVADTADLSLSFDAKVKPAVLLPKTLHEITDTATGTATFPDKTTADATATDTIPLDRGTITATGRTIHGFARLPLPTIERTIATFTDTDPSIAPRSFSIVIVWGDGTASLGFAQSDPAGGFDVIGNHIYAKIGTYSITVNIRSPGGSSATAGSTGDIQAALVVNSVGMAPVADPTQRSGWTGNSLPNGDLEVTFASAIDQVNFDHGGKIAFNVDPSQNHGTTTIAPNIGNTLSSGAIFTVTAPVVIDGTTQAGGFVKIDGGGTFNFLNGTSSHPTWDCLVLSGGVSTVAGLDIYDFSGWGLVLRGRGFNRVVGNILGTDTAGSAALGNGEHITGFANGDIVGGGLLIDESPLNTIGPNNVFAGNMARAMDEAGRLQYVGGVDVQINGSLSAGNVLSGNLIGVSPSGAVIDGNTTGLLITDAPRNTIGRPSASVNTGNAIVGPATGISVSGSHAIGNVIQANAIGFWPQTGAKGGGTGIQLASGADRNTIGGRNGRFPVGNLIDFLSQGISLQSDSNVVQGNSIDNNSLGGMQVFGSHNLIGGTLAGIANDIGGNGAGVQSSGGATGGNGVTIMDGTGNQILGNHIHDNYLLGIDLANDGVTPNDDSLFSRSGPNDLRNYPVLKQATTSASRVTIGGSLNSVPNQFYRVEFFTSPAASPTGHGEGQTFLGAIFIRLTIGGVDNFTAAFNLPSGVSAGVITATATDSSGNTSEFSNAVTAIG
jgi:uncharacterized repeat protein (TIGR01451 family)